MSNNPLDRIQLPEYSQLLDLPEEEAVPAALHGRWWVAYTRPRNEKALSADLRAMGIHSYLPLRQRETRSRNTGRTHRSFVPVFTSYLFFSATEEERYRALRTNRIVHTIAVSSPDELIRELRHIHHLLRSGKAFELHPQLRDGSWARVVEGPLKGVEGVVSGRLSRMRLVLNVHMLGQSVSVRVVRDMLEPIDAPAPLR